MVLNPSAKINSLCQEGLRLLENAGIPLYEREISDLQGWAMQQFSDPTQCADELEKAIVKRTRRVPLAYIIGQQPFYHRNFLVSPTVLIPRPETEYLVSLILFVLQTLPQPRVIDCGTGSGAIAVTIAAQLPSAQVIATDQSTVALDCARENAVANGVSIDLRLGDLLIPCRGESVDAIIANLPYLPDAWTEIVEAELNYEPPIALFSGPVGLDCITRFLDHLRDGLVRTRWVWLEMLPQQIPVVNKKIQTLFPTATVTVLKDLGGTDRYLQVEYNHE